MKKLGILIGEGIECEKESKRFFQASECFSEIKEISIAKLLKDPEAETNFLKNGDYLFIPGGFSFADHFGAGRLLAYQLSESGVFQKAERIGWNVVGICNGFQMLCCACKFGDRTRLKENQSQANKIGFKNRWVQLKTSKLLNEESYFLPIRHGEGRLYYENKLPDNVQAFLYYDDEQFENGSLEKIAGLSSVIGKARYWGMMPHPEIALYPIQSPNVTGSEFFERFRQKVNAPEGDGLKLWRSIFKLGSDRN